MIRSEVITRDELAAQLRALCYLVQRTLPRGSDQRRGALLMLHTLALVYDLEREVETESDESDAAELALRWPALIRR